MIKIPPSAAVGAARLGVAAIKSKETPANYSIVI